MSIAPRCIHCQAATAAAIESRLVGTTIRRRRQCPSCGQRFTTYEVQQEDWQRLTAAAGLLQRIEAAMRPLLTTPVATGIACDSCRYASATGCSFGYPEYGTADASDCVMHEATG